MDFPIEEMENPPYYVVNDRKTAQPLPEDR
jgi:hypothetical protein